MGYCSGLRLAIITDWVKVLRQGFVTLTSLFRQLRLLVRSSSLIVPLINSNFDFVILEYNYRSSFSDSTCCFFILRIRISLIIGLAPIHSNKPSRVLCADHHHPSRLVHVTLGRVQGFPPHGYPPNSRRARFAARSLDMRGHTGYYSLVFDLHLGVG